MSKRRYIHPQPWSVSQGVLVAAVTLGCILVYAFGLYHFLKWF